MPNDLTTAELHHVIRTFAKRVGAHQPLSSKAEWAIVDPDELKSILALQDWPRKNASSDELQWCSEPLSHKRFPRFKGAAVFWRMMNGDFELWISKRVGDPSNGTVVISSLKVLGGIASTYRIVFSQEMLDDYRKNERRRRLKNILGSGSPYVLGLLVFTGMYFLSPPDSLENIVARLISIAFAMLLTRFVTVPIRKYFGRKYVLLVTPPLLMFLTYALILVYMRLGWVNLPDEYLFGLSLVISLVYGMVVAAVKFRDMDIKRVVSRFMATLSISVALAFGTLQVMGNTVAQISIDSPAGPFGFVTVPALLYALYELTKREFARDE